MNKQDNKLAISVVAALTAGIALIYTLIMYRTIIFAVAGVSIIFLITAFILTQNIITFVTIKNKSMNVHIKNCVDDISSQLEAINGVQTQLGKATYIYTRQAAQKVATLENNYAESQAVLYKNLASISSRQNKATKLMIKSDQNNTVKLIDSIKDVHNKLNETMINGFDQIQPNNTEIITVLESIADYLKNQAGSYEQTLGIQLDNVANELQNISNNIQNVQAPAANIIQSVPAAAEPDIPISADYTEQTEVLTTEITEDIPNDDIPAEDVPAESSIDDYLTENTITFEENIAKDNTAVEPAAPSIEEAVAEDTVTEEEEEEQEQAFSPTFTVVGKADDDTEHDSLPSPADIPDDPNKQLSADEIAALFASAEPTPKKEPAHAQKPSVEASSDDSKQLSADEIAALFAASEPAPKKEIEPATQKQKMNTATANNTPASDDTNKKLSPDEIAALFASMG